LRYIGILVAIFLIGSCKPLFQKKSELAADATFKTDSPLIVGDAASPQAAESGYDGYDLAKEGFDITRYKKGWFDITCQFKLKKDSKWVHIVNEAGYRVDPSTYSDYCNNTVFQTAKSAADQYLLIGYTPKVSGARDGSDLKKNFAVMMRAFVRQNILSSTNQETSSGFSIDGYLLDYRFSSLVEQLSRQKNLFALDKVCKFLSTSGQVLGNFTNAKQVLDEFQKASGIGGNQFLQAQFWNDVADLDAQGFRTQMSVICDSSGGPAIDISAGYSDISAAIVGQDDVGSVSVYSFGRSLYAGALQVSPEYIKTRFRSCRYQKLSPHLSIDTDVLPMVAAMAGVDLAVSGKICFNSYIYLEREKLLGTTNECADLKQFKCVPDYTLSYVSTPAADISIGATASAGFYATPFLGTRAGLHGDLQLVSLDMKSTTSGRYINVDGINQMFITALDYSHRLMALSGKLSVKLDAGMTSLGTYLFKSMTGIIKAFDKFAKVGTDLEAFQSTYLSVGKAFDLVQFPKQYVWSAFSQVLPVVFTKDKQGQDKFSKSNDGCACYALLANLVDTRRILIHTIECLADQSQDDLTTRGLATDKTKHVLLFGELEAYCHKNLAVDNCPAKELYTQRKNQSFFESSTRITCDGKVLGDLLNGTSEK
jgi:hypothetical protein